MRTAEFISIMVPSGALTPVMAPAAEFACNSVLSSELACLHLGGGKENEVAGKSGVRQGGRIWSTSTIFLALPITCTLVSIPDLDFKLIAGERSAGGSDLAGKSESAKYDLLALEKSGSSAIGGSGGAARC